MFVFVKKKCQVLFSYCLILRVSEKQHKMRKIKISNDSFVRIFDGGSLEMLRENYNAE